MEIHRHPALTRAWSAVGKQPEVPAPGKNEKRVVYGGVDYKTGHFTYTVAATKCGAEFLVFLLALLKRYAGQKIILVCDNGRFHTTQAVREFLTAHRDHLRVFWLPPYSPSLNLIERLWGHIKAHHIGQHLVRHLERTRSRFPPRRQTSHRRPRQNGLHVRSR